MVRSRMLAKVDQCFIGSKAGVGEVVASTLTLKSIIKRKVLEWKRCVLCFVREGDIYTTLGGNHRGNKMELLQTAPFTLDSLAVGGF